ncbi:MAG: nucleotidyltransferase family protein [Pseudomonadota bacterium]
MVIARGLAGIMLAAGRSRRFGRADKLIAPYEARPLICHAATALSAIRPEHLIVVTRSSRVAALLPGWHVVAPEAGLPQSASLRAGIAAAIERDAQRALIVLGDMPAVTKPLLEAVVARMGEGQAAAATDGKRRLPPAGFPKAYFSDLMAAQGDQGARALLAQIPGPQLVLAKASELHDVDRPADLN